MAIRKIFRLLPPPILQKLRCLLRRDHVVYRGSVLPLPSQRRNMCGAEYASDEFFLESAIGEAQRLEAKLGCTVNSAVVDLGCGLGRLAIGLVRDVGAVPFWGFDVVKENITWCRKHIQQHHPSFRSAHLDVANARYNPKGTPLTKDFRLPLPDGQADIVYLWGLLTNMEPEHMPIYVAETSRILREGGAVFLTAFVEKDVPSVSLNPDRYTNYECAGPLHVVRYEKNFLFSTFRQHGLNVQEYSHHVGRHCNQSEIYLRKQYIAS